MNTRPETSGIDTHITDNRKLRGYYKDLSIIVALGLIILTLSLISPHFLTINNLINIFLQSANIMLIAVGLTFIFIGGQMDLSLGSIEALAGSVVAVAMVNFKLPIFIAILIGIMSGVFCGIANGFLVSRFYFPPFIATLGMQSIARGLGLIITRGTAIFGFPESFKFIGQGRVWIIPVPIILFVIALLIAHFILKHTKFGVNVYAVGSNEQAAGLSGINVKFVKMAIYVISGIMGALAGIVMTSRLNSGQATIGEYDVMDAIASVVIGGTSMRGGVGSIRGTFIGVLIISSIRNGLNILGVTAYVQQVAIGLIIIIAILIDQISKGELKK